MGSQMRLTIRPIEGPEVVARIRVLHTQSSTSSGFYLIGAAFEDLKEGSRQNLLILLETISRLEASL